MGLTVWKFILTGALFLSAGLALAEPESAPATSPGRETPEAAASQAPVAPPQATPPAEAPQAPAQKTARTKTGPTIIEETADKVEGLVVGVPIPKVTKDTYINAGAAQGVKPGEYFLAFSPTVRTIAVLRVISCQDRMSAVETRAQLASLREGDRVKRISENSAKALAAQIIALSGFAPPLDSEVVISPEMARVAEKVSGKAPETAPPAPTALKPREEMPLLAKAGGKGVEISWAPVEGAKGYLLFRSDDPALLGSALTPAPTRDLNFADRPEKAGTYFYRLLAEGSDGSRGMTAPSIEVEYTPARIGIMGMGGAPAQAKAKALPPFSMPAAAPPQALETVLLAKTDGKSVDISWAAIGGANSYLLSRTERPEQLGKPLMKSPVATLKFSDRPPKSGVYIYRLVAHAADGSRSKMAPSISVDYTAPRGGIMGIAGSPARVSAVSMEAFDVSTAPVIEEAAVAPKKEKQAKAAPPPAPAPAVAPPPGIEPKEIAREEEPAGDEEEAEGLPPTPEKVDVKLEGTTVVIKWNPVASKTPLAGYVVYRAYLRGAGYPLTDVPVRSTTYRDRSAKPGTTYEYWVSSQTIEGRTSESSPRRAVEIPTSGPIPFF